MSRKPRRRGGSAGRRRPSREQVPVLIAVDRSGAPLGAVLPAATAKAIGHALALVLSEDARLVTDAARPYPPCAAALGVTHEVLNRSAGQRVRGDLHIQTAGSRHERLKSFLRRYRGIATSCLASYLEWFHLAGLHPDP
ncbi:IS1595 family transposase, partial [Marinimicrococcus flavescens]|nr:IS1595 family transposase [Marinimicrococcus flavescens]